MASSDHCAPVFSLIALLRPTRPDRISTPESRIWRKALRRSGQRTDFIASAETFGAGRTAALGGWPMPSFLGRGSRGVVRCGRSEGRPDLRIIGKLEGGTRMPTIKTKDGVEIFFKDWGSGQPIVFSHGWPLAADDWDAQMMFFLNHGYRVIAHDRRGHGRST